MATNSQSGGGKWEGYSNYEVVSKRVSKSVSDAIDGYATVHSYMIEGQNVPPDVAADARTNILSAAMRLLVEMEEEQSRGVDEYDEILGKWTGEDGEDGRLQEFQKAKLHQSVPGWLFQFVLDIRRAAWSLGYLQAGRRGKQQPDDPIEAEAQSMFEDL